jgi:hypothetical protein
LAIKDKLFKNSGYVMRAKYFNIAVLLFVFLILPTFFCCKVIAGDDPKPKNENIKQIFSSVSDFDHFHKKDLKFELSNPEKKSSFLAVCYSVLLPGMGELYANRFDVGRYSLISEVGLWLTFAGINRYGYLSQRDARSFARLHAGFDNNNKDDDYYINIENSSNIYDYNEKRLRERNLSGVYNPQSNLFWQWDSDDNRLKYRSMRIHSDEVINNLKYVSIVMIANRVISAINAARFVSQYNKSLSALGNMDFSLGVIQKDSHYDGLCLNFRTSF